MGKRATPRRLSDTEAQAVAHGLRSSPRKLNVVAAAIRGLDAEQALAQLTFQHRRIGVQVRTALQSAIANAENNHHLDVDRLYVSEAYVGKGLVMRRWHARGRGRTGQVAKAFSNLTIVVREREEKK
ncbi:MAG: 50S ribosomal protein L22 [Alphaproteobacteria bacterium]